MRPGKTIIKGDRFNYLTVIEFSHSDKRHRKWFKVKCDCGVEKILMGSAMVSGNTKSCGCLSSKFKKDRSLLPGNLGVKRQIILQYKRHARDRGILYNISESDFISLLENVCHYCGSAPSNLKKTKNFKEGLLYNGIDRKDSNQGYSKENCVPCCNICNKAKLAMSVDDFLGWAHRVYNHSINKPENK